MNNTKRKTEYKSVFYVGQIWRLVTQMVLGIGLLAGGIAILALRIAGWSSIFGIPMVVISSVFIIYTYDDTLNRHLDLHDHQEYHNEKTDEEKDY
jgi:hypothetical protein